MMVYGLEQDPTLNDGNRRNCTFGYAECIALVSILTEHYWETMIKVIA